MSLQSQARRTVAGLFLGTLLTLTAHAGDIVIEDSFDAGLAQWKPMGAKVKALDGQLVIAIPQGTTSAGSYVNGQITSEGRADLNFFRAPVEIALEGIAMSGTATPSAYHFGYWLGERPGYSAEQGAFLHVYIRAGKLSVQFYARPSDSAKPELRVPVDVPVTLPLERLTLRLDADGYTVSVVDASGEQSMQSTWQRVFSGGLLEAWKSGWKNVNPILCVQLTEGMDPGGCEVTLDAIKIVKDASR
jgi:hypothetical protein